MNSIKSYDLKKLGPLRVEGHIQSYAWGKIGAASRISSFTAERISEQPLAEYWLGCHPKGEALAILPDGSRCPLTRLFQAESQLPFMLKVLSINPAFGLSIQSHPDTELARKLHARDPEHYPDPFHKPEVGIAITPVKLLYNIKTSEALRQVVEAYPEIVSLLSEQTRSGLGVKLSADTRKDIFCDCITAKPQAISKVVDSIFERFIGKGPEQTPEEILIMQRLAETHGTEDAGLVVLLLMNLVSLDPGEGFFIGPNIPHAYLDGDLVECMACSDNVIRAGLTSKFRDVQTLIETTAFEIIEVPEPVPLRGISEDHHQFMIPAQEFQISIVQAGANRVQIDLRSGHALMLCVGEDAVVSYGLNGESITLSDGQAVLLPQGLIGCNVSTGAAAQLFIAHSGSR
jgi:mannose-6-phosphate isomerase